MNETQALERLRAAIEHATHELRLGAEIVVDEGIIDEEEASGTREIAEELEAAY